MYRLQTKPNATATALQFKHVRTNTLKLTEEIKRNETKRICQNAAVSKTVCTDRQANDKKELQ